MLPRTHGAEAPSTGKEPGSEGERAEDCTGPQRTWTPLVPRAPGLCARTPAPQPAAAKRGHCGVEPKDKAAEQGDKQWGGEWSPAQTSAPQQLTMEGGDGETYSSQGHTDGSWTEPQCLGNCLYCWSHRDLSPGDLASINTETHHHHHAGECTTIL
uniref:Uncharacterized protein n=1 Tax=Oryctolagus cuniculus TaxID=9986 RepID=A0A5F9D3X5_RABIT